MSNTKKPNILWICTDQQRFDTLGCYYNGIVNTPNIDRLAEKGVLFKNAYCQCPVCSPSRASFLTGRYPKTTRCRQNGQKIPDDEMLVSRIFADEGYVCGLSGKLHLAPCHPSVCKGMEERINDGYHVFHWSHGGHDGWATHEYFQWLREKGVKFRSTKAEGSEYVEYGMDSDFSQTKWCVDKAMEFIETNNEYGNSWMFSLNLYDPHHPFDPPKKYLERYIDMLDDIPSPNFVEGELSNKPYAQKMCHMGKYNNKHFEYKNMSANDHRMLRAAYWSMVENIDTHVGRILDLLNETNELENTIIIFTSDHGEMLGDHGLYLKGPFFYEPAVHVPLIISWPGKIKSGKISKALVELTDISPTLMEASGLEQYRGMQGKSLYKLLTGKSPLDYHRNSVYCEYHNSMKCNESIPNNATMVFDGRYKLVSFHGVEDGEMYDLFKDKNETVNLWYNKKYVNEKIKMLKLLSDRVARTADPLPERKAVY